MNFIRIVSLDKFPPLPGVFCLAEACCAAKGFGVFGCLLLLEGCSAAASVGLGAPGFQNCLLLLSSPGMVAGLLQNVARLACLFANFKGKKLTVLAMIEGCSLLS